MPRADVWIIKRRRKLGDTYAVRWVDPSTGRMRCESAGRDSKLAKDFASRKREELRQGINNDPIDAPWDEYVTEVTERAEMQKSKKYRQDIARVLDLFKMICSARSPLAVSFSMGDKFKNARLRGARRCRRRTCSWPNGVDREACWKCGSPLGNGTDDDGKPIYLHRKVDPNTVNKDLRTLRAVFGYAVKRYRLPAHPFEGVDDVEAHPRPIRALKPAEQRRVLDACPDIRWKIFLYLGMTTGLRRRELCDLKWDDIDLDARLLYVRKAKAKKCRTARLTDEAMQLLAALRMTHAHPILFVGENGRDFYDQVGPGLEKIVKAAGIPRFTFHDTRKTFATDLARGGVNQRVATALVGHSSIQTTAKYYQAVDDEMVDNAISSLPLVRGKTA